MKLILQNGQQFCSRGPSTGALTSVNVSPPANFFAGRRKHQWGRRWTEGGKDRRDFPSTAYQTLQGFPFRPPAEFLQPAGNVKRKFRSFEINSAPRDCVPFTRLEYLASGRYSQSRYQSFRILQRQSRNVSYWANETGKGEYPIFRPRFILAVRAFPFCCLTFFLHNATLGAESLRETA